MRDKTTQEIAAIFSVDESTVKRWVKEGLPCEQNGKGRARRFDEGEVAEWLKSNRLTGKVGRPKEAVSADLQAARLRKENAIAELHEIKIAKEKGLLVEKAQVDEANIRKIIAVKNGLLGMGAKLAPTLEGLTTPEIQESIDKRVAEILEQFSK